MTESDGEVELENTKDGRKLECQLAKRKKKISYIQLFSGETY